MFQFNGLIKLAILEFIFEDPTILDELDHLYKSDTARKLLFYYQPDTDLEEGSTEESEDVGDTEEKKEGIVDGVRYKDRPRELLLSVSTIKYLYYPCLTLNNLSQEEAVHHGRCGADPDGVLHVLPQGQHQEDPGGRDLPEGHPCRPHQRH